MKNSTHLTTHAYKHTTHSYQHTTHITHNTLIPTHNTHNTHIPTQHTPHITTHITYNNTFCTEYFIHKLKHTQNRSTPPTNDHICFKQVCIYVFETSSIYLNKFLYLYRWRTEYIKKALEVLNASGVLVAMSLSYCLSCCLSCCLYCCKSGWLPINVLLR